MVAGRQGSQRWWIVVVVAAAIVIVWFGYNRFRHARFFHLVEEGQGLIDALAAHRPESLHPAAWRVAVKEVVYTAWINVLNSPSGVDHGELESVVAELRERVAKAEPETAPDQLSFVLDALESLRPSRSSYVQNCREQLNHALTWKTETAPLEDGRRASTRPGRRSSIASGPAADPIGQSLKR